MLVSLFASVASADDRSLGISLARDGRCEAALELLIPLRARPARDAELERLAGECAIRLKRFDVAVDALEAARTLEPGAPGLDLHLAQAYYHQGQLDPAERALERAVAGGAEGALTLLYAGLIAFDRGDDARAIEQLSAAAAHSDDSVEPMASFFLARAQHRAEDRLRARKSFEQSSKGIRDRRGRSRRHARSRVSMRRSRFPSGRRSSSGSKPTTTRSSAAEGSGVRARSPTTAMCVATGSSTSARSGFDARPFARARPFGTPARRTPSWNASIRIRRAPRSGWTTISAGSRVRCACSTTPMSHGSMRRAIPSS